MLLPKPSRILATLSVAFVIASCAPAIQFRQPHPSVDVCVQRNENLSDSENASFDSVVREAAGMVRHCRVVQHCDSGDTTPRLAFRPFRYDYASTAERIFKPAITVASVAGAAYTAPHYGFFVVLWPMPRTVLSYEVGANKATRGEQSVVRTIGAISFRGGPERQREAIAPELATSTRSILENIQPSEGPISRGSDAPVRASSAVDSHALPPGFTFVIADDTASSLKVRYDFAKFFSGYDSYTGARTPISDTATTPLIARELAELGGVRSSAPDAQYTVVYRQVLGWDMGEIVKRMTLCMVPSAHGVDSTICAEFSEETLFNTHPTRKSTVRKLVSLLQGDTNAKKLNPAKYRRYRLAVESRATLP